ncbi:basic proline-rich protein-like isoform X2 [Anolis carolinensis]|uniref:basic proline-rich protein-like isoform X2 n=1 Tax=Anolis carolinensis TaxID=28377 RepID=UPI002F2B4AB1
MELPFVVAILMAFAHCTDAQRYFPPPRGDSVYDRHIGPGYPVPHPYPPPPPPRYPAPPASVYDEGFQPKPQPPPPPPGHHGSQFSPPNYARPAYPYSGDNERRWSWTSFFDWFPLPDIFGAGDERGRPHYYPPPPPPPPRFTGFGSPGLIDPGFSPHFRPGFNRPPFPGYPANEFPPPQENPENVSPPPPGNSTVLPPGNPGNKTLPSQVEPTPQP